MLGRRIGGLELSCRGLAEYEGGFVAGANTSVRRGVGPARRLFHSSTNDGLRRGRCWKRRRRRVQRSPKRTRRLDIFIFGTAISRTHKNKLKVRSCWGRMILRLTLFWDPWELRDMAPSDDMSRRARKDLERAAESNPNFAPTFEALTQAYSRSAETQAKALEAAETAVKLDPESRSYRMSLAYTLLNNRRAEQAQVVAENLASTATSKEDKRAARSVMEAIADEEEWEKSGVSEGVMREFGPPGSGEAQATAPAANTPVSRRQLGSPEWMAVEGSIAGVDCARSPELTLTLNLPRGPMDFHAKDFGVVSVSGESAASVPAISSCKSWTGRNVKIWFRMAQGQGFLGEITRIYFY